MNGMGGHETRESWTIYVTGYGFFEFEGTEAEAEEARKAKSQWEGGAGHKFRTNLSRESDRLTAEMVGLWRRGKGVPYALLSKIKKARAKESSPPTPADVTASAARGETP